MVTKQQILEQFGGAGKVARALGITRQAVYQWPDRIPAESAIKLSLISRWSLREIRPDLFRDDRAA